MQEYSVEVASGRLAGVALADGVWAFRGIPYAKPPLAALRWRAPQPVEPWPGVRRADAFAPRCVQPNRRANSISYFGPEAESEDCLYLNVWSAAKAGDRRPVMVWIYGGAFYVGSGALPLFNGEFLARAGAVIVTINYRIGRLGFLAHPELTQESGFSGNYGLIDQIAALGWVKRNIAEFGGDPGCVTVFGQSAGSISGSLLMASPLAKALFHRVIGQSGALFGPVAASCNTGDSIQSLAAAERTGAEFARKLGAASLAELRTRAAHDIQLLHRPGATGDGNAALAVRGEFDTNWPVVDGVVLPESPHALFAQGRQNDVPVLLGTTANEGATMPFVASVQALREQARADHGERAGRFLELYPARADAEARLASRTAFSYRNFYWQNWTWARLQARTGTAPVFYYQFTRAPPIPPQANYAENPPEQFGAFHCAEIPYVFRNLAIRDWPWSEVDRRLSDTISRYWLNFAGTGDPNGDGLPRWPRFDAGAQMTMEFGDETRPAPMRDLPRLEFWDAFYAAKRGEERFAA